MAIVAWRNFWPSEMMNKSTSRVEPELLAPDLKRIDGLDGVRAFAVTLVFISHFFIAVPTLLGQAWYRVFTRGGYLGVNGFFVLSGFLITYRLLGTAHHDGHFRWRQFYAHRAVRLFPAMFFVLGAHFVYAVLFDYPPLGLVSDEWTMVKSTVLQYANWAIYKNPNLFVDNVSLWSLSIEGQFYIFWPILAFFIFQKIEKHTVCLLILSVVITASIVQSSLVYGEHGWFAAYLRTDTRVQSLLVGAMGAALWLRTDLINARVLRVMSIPATLCVILIVRYSKADGSFIWNGGMTLFDISVLLVILALAKDAYLGKSLLQLGFVNWVGKISYGLYLWQIPVFRVIERHGASLSSVIRCFIALGGVFGISSLSWYLLEKPLMKSRWARQLAGD